MCALKRIHALRICLWKVFSCILGSVGCVGILTGFCLWVVEKGLHYRWHFGVGECVFHCFCFDGRYSELPFVLFLCWRSLGDRE